MIVRREREKRKEGKEKEAGEKSKCLSSKKKNVQILAYAHALISEILLIST